MSITSIVIISVLILLLIFSSYFMIKFAMIILKIEEVLEESMKNLERSQESISNILEVPLFFDSPQIKRVHDDIKECRDAVTRVIDSLSSNVSSKKLEETSFEEKEKN